jgi:hypothetical protein
MSSRLLLLAPLFVLACDPIAPGDYPGEQLMKISGTLMLEGLDDEVAQDVRAGLVWVTGDGSTSVETGFLSPDTPGANYELELYHPPGEALLDEVAPGSIWQAAIGHPVLFHDSNGDDIWQTESEALVGGSLDTVVVFAESMPFDGSRRSMSPDHRLTTGFQTMHTEGVPCGDLDEAVRGLSPKAAHSNELVLADMGQHLRSTTCANPYGMLDRAYVLEEACPPAEDMPFFCDNWDAIGERVNDSCWDYCVELEANRLIEESLSTCDSIEDVASNCDNGSATPTLGSFDSICDDLICSSIDEELDLDGFNSCPSAEDMLFHCKFPQRARELGVHRGCIILYCPAGTIKQVDDEPEAEDPATPQTTDADDTNTVSTGPSNKPRDDKDASEK